MKTGLFYIFLLLLLLGCGAEVSRRETAPNLRNYQNSSAATSLCNCGFQLAPVCGANGVSYANSCLANCLGIAHSYGLCEDQPQPKNCDPTSGFVCAQRMNECSTGDFTSCAQNAPAQAYPNECQAVVDRAVVFHYGVCD